MNYTQKKSLGQHFLHDQEICKNIVAHVVLDFPCVEVGPGAGALTQYLLQMPKLDLHCIEIDTEKVNYLLHYYPALQNKITNVDFLQSNPPFETPFQVIGNFPYNISTQIIFQLLEWRAQVPLIIGMFQKEVAVRFASAHGNKNYGITSVITQCFYNIEYLFDVPQNSFTPPPKVMSGVIKLSSNHNPYKIENYKQFKTFIKAAFSQRRKTLRNALKSTLQAETLQDPIFNNRAEQLSVAQFAALYHSIYS
jgi:16S rRNA (adenine1518-N6/adenine1519-N6)-dimethyltransferase